MILLNEVLGLQKALSISEHASCSKKYTWITKKQPSTKAKLKPIKKGCFACTLSWIKAAQGGASWVLWKT